ncbi:hypothetical protein FNY66_01595 [Mediterraneibacter catenae]|jgi:hypothetical protein|uniref:Uncharacterized protein n=1 Tax=Mediterraneibacter catenae TaxID=2594882 RepID=A0A5M9I4F2_9FIRM|nr:MULTISPECIES: hypothetical protein [Mediterraneibacter]OUO31027.1 hypothetical protein B5F86_02705 [Lachnoclostridium sp. An298]HJD03791.1 hypothetical protein [Candidatus Mediterraneibacter caccogallinarum]KAA8502969.1 hypothetical protein FNY66_01595 [Mediterraneibacter catenae]MCF2567840.1 hypothetical protein [Mediterraneibacter glycyrrhizinilyticus]MDN0043100.1 hypothetical protein [Mediterraneibacter glycyrrhizinilyticus]
MKEKILTAVSTLMIFIPWTILPLRTCSWALESPAAEIIIYSYAAFMVFSGIFTLLSYTTAGVKNILMKICLVITLMYAAGAVAIIGMTFV